MLTVNLPTKPRFGSPCNGCGLCCRLSLCFAAQELYGVVPGPCPHLKIAPDGTRTICELVQLEKDRNLDPLLQISLGIGFGCGMADDDTPDDEFQITMTAWSLLAASERKAKNLNRNWEPGKHDPDEPIILL